MAKLRIERSMEWNNKLRSINIYLNNKKIGSLKDGEQTEIEVPPGRHILQAKIDWCGSKKTAVIIAENEVKKVYLSSFPGGKWVALVSLSMFLIWAILYGFFDLSKLYAEVPMLLLGAYFFYFLTFGRNRYLQIREV